MAVTAAIYYGMTVIDLTDTTNSIFLQEDLYVPVVVTPTGDGSIPPYVTETLPVGLNATTYDGYATLMQGLADMQKKAAEYWVEQQQSVPVYFNCKLDGETNTRRALVKSIDFSFDLRNWTEWLYQQCGTTVPPKRLFGTILLERHPYWERTSTRTFPNATPAAAAAVAYDYTATADVVGDVPARVNALGMRCPTGGGVALVRFWLGIRSTVLHGPTAVTNFVPIWECEDGTRYNDVTLDSTGGASEPNLASPGGGNGDFIIVSENLRDWDDTWWPVEYIETNHVGYASAEDALGQFLWLMRAKVTAGTWEVRIRAGYAVAHSYHDPVEVSSTDWNYYVMGVSSLSPRDLQAIEAAFVAIAKDDYAGVHVEAQRTSGAGDLKIDCFCPIPVDEGFLHIPDAYIETANDATFGQGPSEHMQVLDVSALHIGDLYSFEVDNFRLPPGDGRIICVYARTATSVLTDQVEFADASNVTNAYTERWTALRGTE